MQWLNILVVEDETPLAEMHAEFIKQSRYCGQVWLAGNLQQARSMAARFKPDLILLDNYLPDGSGLEFLRELTLAGNTCGIIFITAASDMDTVAEAIRYGVFDYLIKPVAYERLEHSLERFSHRRLALRDGEKVNQRQIDEMYNTYARGTQKVVLPLGIDQLTLDKIKTLFSDINVEYTAENVATTLGLSRTTARRYLEFCSTNNTLQAEIIYGKVGRPQRIYRAKVLI
ncbi:transcriptional regulatory protein DpiA [Yersinia ruckeri]|uniref:two-component response regulator DpiA n=1 Tax=Yersinia ruckeri TaxID=29486 RepID=UPI0005ABEA8D|nr:two-component response regulator DpiA [Yersinia ruckeri]AJI95991.1 transcriptional regulatory protein DpiA [Yersinia ruckeri]MCW6569147.1 two-component response regulator DpiA [Yersinia ruckeri]